MRTAALLHLAVSEKVLVGNNSNNYGGEKEGFAGPITCPMAYRMGHRGPMIPIGAHVALWAQAAAGAHYPIGHSIGLAQPICFASAVPRGLFGHCHIALFQNLCASSQTPGPTIKT